MTRRKQDLQTIRSEGGLLPPDLLRRVLGPRSGLPGVLPEDYGLPAGERLNEVITQAWNRLRKHWAEFRSAAAHLPEGEAGTALTNDKWSLPLLRELGFGLLPTSAGPSIEGRTYAVSRFLGPVPVHLVGCGLSLDRRAAGQRGAAAANPHGLVQELLNRSDAHLWALLSNGRLLRILRDNQSLSRQSFLEFDLEAMFAGEVSSDFVLLWLVAHATRFAPREGGRPETCWLERWAKEAEEQGTRVLGDLRGGVERALQVLGEGFTSHRRNAALREALRSAQLAPADLHAQLLRIVYRLIFLFVAEDRTIEGQPLLHPRDDSDAARTARERYALHYGTARLRELADAIKGSRHGDLWRQFQLLVGALSGDPADPGGAATREHLALPALGSFLWDPASTAALNDAELTNHDLLEALRHLAFTRQGKVLRPVDYKNLGAEELGGVYESLLALTPQISADGARFSFAEFADNERKKSGSYYTPDSLVQCLLDSALDPVVEEAIAGKSGAEAEQALLALKVCDPAVGSGHFLVGAAHRLARHLARVRALASGESEPSPLLYQQALRDVIGRCLYGVDVNPMAAELCRVSLWLEALEPGKPLSFLDHHVRVGNSLLGATPELVAAGLPDDAFKPIEGDDRAICSQLKKKNRQERVGGQGDMLHLMVTETPVEYSTLVSLTSDIEAAPDATLEDVRLKAERFHRLVGSSEYCHAQQVADAWCAAFVWPKRADAPADPITTDTLRRLEADPDALAPSQLRELDRLAGQHSFFHWHLTFPEVFSKGGFNCVLGNPPWVRQEGLARIKRLLGLWPAFSATADLSVFFVDLSLNILTTGGRLGILTPNKWLRNKYGAPLRAVLRQRAEIALLMDFGHSRDLFSDADTFPAACVFISVTTPPVDSSTFMFVQARDEERQLFGIGFLVASQGYNVTYRELRPEGWHLNPFQEQDLFQRMHSAGTPLVELLGRPIRRGVTTGCNEAFLINDETRRELVALDADAAYIIHPWIRGRDVKRWVARSSGMHLIFTRRGINIDLFPVIKNHLLPFRQQLEPKESAGAPGPGRKPGQYAWYEIQDETAYFKEFERPRILLPSILYHSEAAIVSEVTYPSNKVNVLPSADLALLAVLNSRSMWWLMNRHFVGMKDGALSVDVDALGRLPIPSIGEAGQAALRERAAYLIRCAGQTTINSKAPHAWSTREIALAELVIESIVARAFGLSEADAFLVQRSAPERDPVNIATRSLDGTVIESLRSEAARIAARVMHSVAHSDAAIALRDIANGALVRPMQDARAESGAALAAVLKALEGSAPARTVRLAAALVLEPRLAIALLDAAEQSEWRRLVGAEADPLPSGVARFVPAADQAWGAAVRHLRGHGMLVEDSTLNTWTPGPGLADMDTTGWPDGRARMVLSLLQRLGDRDIVHGFPDHIRRWIDGAAA